MPKGTTTTNRRWRIHPSAEASDAYQQVSQFARRVSHLCGIPVGIISTGSEAFVQGVESVLAPEIPAAVMTCLKNSTEPSVIGCGTGVLYYGIPQENAGYICGGFILEDADNPPAWLRRSTVLAGWSDSDFRDWLDQQPRVDANSLRRLLNLACLQLRQDQTPGPAPLDPEVDILRNHLQRVRNENAFLHGMIERSRVGADLRSVTPEPIVRLQRRIRAGGGLLWRPGVRMSPILKTVTTSEVSIPDVLEFVHWLELQPATGLVMRSTLDETVPTLPGMKNFIAMPVSLLLGSQAWIILWNHEEQTLGGEEQRLIQSTARLLAAHAERESREQAQDEMLFAFVKSLVTTLDAKDPYTRGHSERVGRVARRLAQELGLSADDTEAVSLAALLHDVGKVGIDDAVLRKAGPLDDQEMRHVELHPLIGHRILSHLPNFNHILDGVKYHHERIDGQGYPCQLLGEEIPLVARILAVADAFDAMSSDRPYRAGMPRERVEMILQAGSGTQWDSLVIAAFFEARNDIYRIINTTQSFSS